MRRIQYYLAALAAFLLGMPLTQKAFAQVGDIIWASLDLADAIVDSAGDS